MKPTSTAPWLVVLSLGIGALAGALPMWWASRSPAPDPPQVVERVRDYDSEELEIVCLPYMRQTATILERAQTRVSVLELRIRDKEREIAELEGRVSAQRRAAEIEARLQDARAQLDGLEAQLAAALAEKEELLERVQSTSEELDRTRTALAAQQRETRVAQQEAADQRWSAFVRAAQLTICEQGTRASLERCREDVAASLARQELRYKACVRSNQAVPQLRPDADVDELPTFGVRLATAGPLRRWYILFCDPLLPEARLEE